MGDGRHSRKRSWRRFCHSSTLEDGFGEIGCHLHQRYVRGLLFKDNYSAQLCKPLVRFDKPDDMQMCMLSTLFPLFCSMFSLVSRRRKRTVEETRVKKQFRFLSACHSEWDTQTGSLLILTSFLTAQKYITVAESLDRSVL